MQDASERSGTIALPTNFGVKLATGEEITAATITQTFGVYPMPLCEVIARLIATGNCKS